jgi:hypothetical protein
MTIEHFLHEIASNRGDVLSELDDITLDDLIKMLLAAYTTCIAHRQERLEGHLAELTGEVLSLMQQSSTCAAAPQLLDASQFALSVLKTQGLYDMSERQAHNKLVEAINAACKSDLDKVEI